MAILTFTNPSTQAYNIRDGHESPMESHPEQKLKRCDSVQLNFRAPYLISYSHHAHGAVLPVLWTDMGNSYH
jgi:hypothetical protein